MLWALLLALSVTVTSCDQNAAHDTCEKGAKDCDGPSDSGKLESLISNLFAESQNYHVDDLSSVAKILKLLGQIDQLQTDVTKDQARWLVDKDPASQEKIAAFKAWCNLRDVHTIGVEVQKRPGMGVGIFATRDLDRETTIMDVPLSASISSALVKPEFQCLGKLAVSNPMYDATWFSLPLALKLLVEVEKGKESAYGPYIDLLPKAFDHPVYFELEDFEALMPSAVFNDSVYTFQETVSMYGLVWLRLFQNAEKCAKAEPKMELRLERLTWKAFQWAYTIALTRNYDGSFKQETNKGDDMWPKASHKLTDDDFSVLIPFWDMANHNDEGQMETTNNGFKDTEVDGTITVAGTKYQNGHYEGYLDKPVTKGEELCHRYLNPLPTSEAFSTWGFVHISDLKIPFRGLNEDQMGQANEMAKNHDLEEGLLTISGRPSPEKRIFKGALFADLVNVALGSDNAEFSAENVQKTWRFLREQAKKQLDTLESIDVYTQRVEEAKKTQNRKRQLVYRQLMGEAKFLKEFVTYAATLSGLKNEP